MKCVFFASPQNAGKMRQVESKKYPRKYQSQKKRITKDDDDDDEGDADADDASKEAKREEKYSINQLKVIDV